MILKDIIREHYSVDMYIGDIAFDPYPVSLFISYPKRNEGKSCYMQFEAEYNDNSTLFSMDIYDDGLIKEISLITHHILNTININKNYSNLPLHIEKGMPTFHTQFIKKEDEEGDECQFFSDEFIGYILKGQNLIVLFSTQKPYTLVEASSQLSFIFDINYKMIAINISFAIDEFQKIKKWFKE